jgi:hypothetical protein
MRRLELPYAPAEYEAQHVSAVQLLEKGECPEHLQKEFLRWLIEDVCRTYDMSYRVEPCDTAFAEGRRFSGNQVIKMLKLDASKVRREDEPEHR